MCYNNSRGGQSMNKEVEAKNIIKELGGIAKTSDLNKRGIQNYELSYLYEEGYINKTRHGYYRVEESSSLSEEVMLASYIKEAIVCMESALLYYGYSDHTPNAWTIAVPRTISRTKIKNSGLKLKVYYVLNDKFELGKSEGIFNGIQLAVYDRERVLCDCFKYRNKMDSETFNKALKAYANDNEKNITNLIKYAKELRVYKKVVEIMGVLLNG